MSVQNCYERRSMPFAFARWSFDSGCVELSDRKGLIHVVTGSWDQVTSVSDGLWLVNDKPNSFYLDGKPLNIRHIEYYGYGCFPK